MPETGSPVERHVASVTPAHPPALALSGVSRHFGTRRALDAVTLDVRPGELLSVLGPSGSGKTTLLRVVAGFEPPDTGEVALAGRVVAASGRWVEPEHRGVGLVPQGDTLFPHLSVRQNVEFGVRRTPDRAALALEMVGLADRAGCSPGELSGGERQRVALARALAPGPALVLLDEPFSALDASLRVRLRAEVIDVLRRAGATGVLVTHDQDEALSVADRVAVLRDGRLVQCGTPSDLYWQPADLWTARFLGDVNVLPGQVSGSTATTAVGSFLLPVGFRPGAAEIAVRPDALVLHADPAGPAVVTSRNFYGHDALVSVRHDHVGPLLVRMSSLERFEAGDRVSLRPHPRARAVPVLGDAPVEAAGQR